MNPIDAAQSTSVALRKRVAELAVGSTLPVVFDQSAQWQRAWEMADFTTRMRALVSCLRVESLRLSGPTAAHSQIAVLPQPQLMRMFLARALYSRIDALRRCVDRRSRQWFVQQLGEEGWHWMITRLSPPSVLPLLPSGDEHLQEWFADGWQRLYVDKLWASKQLAHLAAVFAHVHPFEQKPLCVADGRSAAFVHEWELFMTANAEAA